jgi:pimeloyl-ACP methyl ester carboxylesterase
MGHPRRAKLSTPLAALLLLSACATQGSPSAVSQVADEPSPTPDATGAEIETRFAGEVEVAPGRSVSARCFGQGTPTILLEAGGTQSNLNDWAGEFVSGVASVSTVCLYSRAGGYGSDPVEGLLTEEQIVSDADALLATLRDEHGIEPPYVLTGWSFGGTVVLAEALAHPETTAGLVILDTGFPVDFMKVCARSGRSKADCRREYREDEEAKSIEADLVPLIRPLPDIPMAIVSAMVLDDCTDPDGDETLSADASGTLLTARSCDELAGLFADKARDDWSQVQPDLTETRLDASHNGLTRDAAAELIRIVEQIVAAARK